MVKDEKKQKEQRNLPFKESSFCNCTTNFVRLVQRLLHFTRLHYVMRRITEINTHVNFQGYVFAKTYRNLE